MECNIYDEVENSVISQEEIESIVNAVLTSEKISKESMVSVHIVNDEKMRQFNREYRGEDSTTDVLSFAAKEGISIEQKQEDLGDIFISLPQIVKQADDHNVSEKEEFTRMLVHGTLHLLGYDHQTEEEKIEMFSKQEDIINSIE